MLIRCALWDVTTGEAVSEWHDVEMALEDGPFGVVKFGNVKEHVFVPLKDRLWSGHMATVFPGDPENKILSEVVTHGSDFGEGYHLTFTPRSITFGDAQSMGVEAPEPPAPKPLHFVDRVVEAAIQYALRTGKSPTVVYLGKKETREAWDNVRSNSVSDARRYVRENKLLGYRVVEVREESYLEVG